jgi:chromosome segregation ATPase
LIAVLANNLKAA